MKSFFYLMKQYYSDFADVSYIKFYKPGKVRKLIFWVISVFLIMSFFLMLIVTIKNIFLDISNIFGVIKTGVIFCFGIMLFYFGLLASHLILTEDYVEYVEYFVKRRKIKLCDIKNCEHIFKNGIAPTVRIHSKNSDDPIIDINYSMFNSQDEVNEFVSLLGFSENKKTIQKRMRGKQTDEDKQKEQHVYVSGCVK